MEQNNNKQNMDKQDEKTMIDNLQDEQTLVETQTVNENGETVKESKHISRKAALLAGGGVLLTGTALGATLFNKNNEEIQYDSNNDGVADTIITDSNQNGIYETETKIENEATPLESENDRSWNPNTAPMASEGTVTDEMSFSQAFAAARTELGAGGVFDWHGQYFSTFYAEEMDSNHQPIIDYHTVANHDLPPIDYKPDNEQIADGDDSNEGHDDVSDITDNSNENIETNTQTVNVSNNHEPQIIGLDADGDGITDAVFVDINTDNSADAVLADLNGDGQITEDEVQYIHDSSTLQQGNHVADGTMNVDLNGDGVDEVQLIDLDNNQLADNAIEIGDVNANQTLVNDQTNINSNDTIEYNGEISNEVPEDVPDSELDNHAGDLIAMNDDFNDYNDWA